MHVKKSKLPGLFRKESMKVLERVEIAHTSFVLEEKNRVERE